MVVGGRRGGLPERVPLDRELWGVQALLQLIGLTVVAVLLWGALSSVRPQTLSPSLAVQPPILLRLADNIANDLLPRLDKFFEPDYRIVSLHLPKGISIWALVSIIGNLLSATILFVICVTSWIRERPLVKGIAVATAVASVVLSVIATPLLFGEVTTPTGHPLRLDVSLISLCIFLAYLILDCLFAFDANIPTVRHRFFAVIAGVDLPCCLATAAFIVHNLYVEVPSSFSVGVAAGLFTYYSLAFLFLGTAYWLGTPNGGALMEALRGRAAFAIAMGAALNAAIGFFVHLLKLPIYVDLVGSIFIGLVYGPVVGVLAAIVGTFIVGVTTTPLTIAYVGTAIGTTLAAVYLKRFGYGRRFWTTAWMGAILLGPVSSLLSIPITTYLFSGVTFTGTDVVTAFFVKMMGTTLLTGVAAGAFLFDALDKLLTSLLVYLLYRGLPVRFLASAQRR
jgi:energy-coupling factor transport system substrate-specific component